LWNLLIIYNKTNFEIIEIVREVATLINLSTFVNYYTCISIPLKNKLIIKQEMKYYRVIKDDQMKLIATKLQLKEEL